MEKNHISKHAPKGPGVYKMIDRGGRVIYVGKAKDIKKRLQQYFQKNYEHSSRTKKLLEQMEEIQWISTDTELEALVLENNLIKELRPKYNILMKDDKSYVYIIITMDEDYPRIRIMRAQTFQSLYKKKKGIRVFGPKLGSHKVYESFRFIKKLFPFRHCNLDIAAARVANIPEHELSVDPQRDLVTVTNKVIDYPCLDYSIKRCPGPCIGAITPEAYKKIVQKVIGFLEGNTEEIEKQLMSEMTEAASKRLFEKAARIRDKLFAIQEMSEKQKITDPERIDTDIINFVSDGPHAFFNIFMIRNGKLINQENFILNLPLEGSLDAELIEAYLTQYYEQAADIPKIIVVPFAGENSSSLEAWLSTKKGSAVSILVALKGEKRKLLDLAKKNADWFAKQQKITWMAKEQEKQSSKSLAKILEIKNDLRRIEGYDISHIGGEETVASMVVFENGIAKGKDYRYLRMRTVGQKPDDYRSMEEALVRRLKYIQHLPPEISIKRPKKKYFVEILKICDREKRFQDQFNQRDFVIAKKGETLIAFCRLFPLDPKISLISTLWVAPEFRGNRIGYELMRSLIKKSKKKRVYLDTLSGLEEYFAEFGFLRMKEAPEVMLERVTNAKMWCRANGVAPPPTDQEIIFMVYDVAKHHADESFSAQPDLIVVDGGKGQVNSALSALKKTGVDIPVIGLAKRLEEIYQPGKEGPLLLDEGHEALKLLQRIRDEAHRFANEYQKKAHIKTMLKS